MYRECVLCRVERLESTLDASGTCPFCVENPPAPPEKPKKQLRKRSTKVKIEEPPQIEDEPPQIVTPAEPYLAPQPVVEANPQVELAMRVLCRRKLLPFIKRFRPKYTAGWVHEDICRRLERFVRQVEEKKSPRLLLMMPPRAGKSEIGSRHFPPWVLGQHPDWEIIAASHTSSLTLSFSRYIRDLMRDPAYQQVFADAKLDPTSQSVENWNLTSGGGYLAAGVGTGITGRGAHILLLDDLVKDIEAADSPTISENTWEWYGSTAYTRLAPGGGVLGIMCMTGDTPVMMADGSQRRLDTLKESDSIATYAQGILASSRVAAVRKSGRDSVFKMTMKSGKIVRANQRHPFLTVAQSGELSWTRLKNLNTAIRIVTVKGSGVNGEALSALPRGAKSLPSVVDFVRNTMAEKDGPMGTVRQVTSMSKPVEIGDSNIATALRPLTTTKCTRSKKGAVLFVVNLLKRVIPRPTGRTNLPSITVMRREKCERSCATTVTQESDILLMSGWHWPPRNISDFTLDEIVSIEPDGEEFVYDVQVDHTENFIANGLVSHNTWWSEDDWAGRIQSTMSSGDGDMFEIVKYPAINDYGDEYILPDDTISQFSENDDSPPAGSRLTRPKDTALHPARYDTDAMLRIKKNLIATGQKRVWQALYQQNPVPDDGLFFTKEMFKYTPTLPQRRKCHVYQAWDFAISEGKDSDFTVGTTLYQDENDELYVADVQRFRSSDSIYIIDMILDYAKQWDADLLGFEDGQIWKTMEAQFMKRCSERKHYPSYEVLKPLTDKQVRAHPLRGRMQAGKIWFLDKAQWFHDLFTEMTRFPAGKHDDQIDSLAWCVRLTLGRNAPRPEKQKKMESWRDKLPSLTGKRAGSHMVA